MSIEAIDKRHLHDQDVVARLKKIDRKKLPSTDQLSYDLYVFETELSIEDYARRGFLLPLNQLDGIQTADELPDALRFETIKVFEDSGSSTTSS